MFDEAYAFKRSYESDHEFPPNFYDKYGKLMGCYINIICNYQFILKINLIRVTRFLIIVSS